MKVALFSAFGLALGGAALWVTASPGGADLDVRAPDPEAGRALYAANCASCHGTTLEGQANWRQAGPDGILPAPPHDETGHTWHHGDGMLFDYTKLGGNAALAKAGVDGFNSGMPGFADVLSDAEIHDILAYIRSTWPQRIQEMQAERTQSEEEAS